MEGGYPQNFMRNKTLSEVKFQEWTQALLQRNKRKKQMLPFVTQYHPAPGAWGTPLCDLNGTCVPIGYGFQGVLS